MGFPDFNEGCKPCGTGQNADVQQYPQVPVCPSQAYVPGGGCLSHKGKFYDRITAGFMVPLVSQATKAYVCEPELWSECQWLAACVGANSIAIFKVTGVNIADKSLNVANACSDGTAITGNPSPGQQIPVNTVIYPIPPPWCGAKLCAEIRAAIEDQNCACEAVRNCLASSDEICFSNIPGLAEGEEVHLFGGTKTNDAGDVVEPGFWRSCLRKILNIFTGHSGFSLCFTNLPETTTAPDIIDGNPVSKRTVLMDGFGCLRAGPVATLGGCDAALDIQLEQDTHHTGDDTGTAAEIAAAAKGRTFSSIKVCEAGVERVLIPSAGCMGIFSAQDEAGNEYWEEQLAGGRNFIFQTPQVIVLGNNINLKKYDKFKRMAGDCGLFAIISVHCGATATGTTTSFSQSLTGNAMLLGLLTVSGSEANFYTLTNAIVRLTENKLTLTESLAGFGATMTSRTFRLRGYQVGGLEPD